MFADIDTKAGKCGAETFDSLELLYGWPETFESASPSGGRHLWYEGAPLFAVGRADTNHPDIDFAQYIVGPRLLACRRHRLSYRQEAADRCGARLVLRGGEEDHEGAPVDQKPVVELDLPGNIAWAIRWLQVDAPPSIEGQGGDDTLVKKVVPPLKDMGISFELACDLVADHYNSRVDASRRGSWAIARTRIICSSRSRTATAIAHSARLAKARRSTTSRMIRPTP